jgi:hypothetical protein
MIGTLSVYRRRSRTIVSAIAFAVTVILMPALSLAGSWPERIVRITTPSAPGSDFVARLFAERLAERWRQPVVIDNLPARTAFWPFKRSSTRTMTTICSFRSQASSR